MCLEMTPSKIKQYFYLPSKINLYIVQKMHLERVAKKKKAQNLLVLKISKKVAITWKKTYQLDVFMEQQDSLLLR